MTIFGRTACCKIKKFSIPPKRFNFVLLIGTALLLEGLRK